MGNCLAQPWNLVIHKRYSINGDESEVRLGSVRIELRDVISDLPEGVWNGYNRSASEMRSVQYPLFRSFFQILAENAKVRY